MNQRSSDGVLMMHEHISKNTKCCPFTLQRDSADGEERRGRKAPASRDHLTGVRENKIPNTQDLALVTSTAFIHKSLIVAELVEHGDRDRDAGRTPKRKHELRCGVRLSVYL